MKISIVTNEKNTSLFNKFIQEFAFNLTNITNAVLINRSYNEKSFIKNPNNSKKLTLFPYKDYLNNELKIVKNNFYIFSAGLFSLINELSDSDIILLFINLDKLDENNLFKLFKKINQYKVDMTKTIFIPWCKTISDLSKMNLIHLENILKNNLMIDIFELDKYHDKEFIKLIIKKIQDF